MTLTLSGCTIAGAESTTNIHGISIGTGGDTFSPDMLVSRAQAVTFLWRELA